MYGTPHILRCSTVAQMNHPLELSAAVLVQMVPDMQPQAQLTSRTLFLGTATSLCPASCFLPEFTCVAASQQKNDRFVVKVMSS